MDFPLAAARKAVREALREDVGAGDATSVAVVPAKARSRARLVSNSEGVVCGLPIWPLVFGKSVKISSRFCDGDRVRAGDVVVELEGPARRILSCERVAINLLSRLSGVATATARCVEAGGGRLRVLDTRKTTPLLRELERYAVRVGGGENHRPRLDAMILVKENHAAAAGGVELAARRAIDWRKKHDAEVEIEVEVRTEDELRAVAVLGVDRIMLDHWDVERTAGAVRAARGLGFRGRIEGSGGMTPERIRALSEAGLDDVSVGSITQSAAPLDFSLMFEGAVA